ncbi:hypothetical protein [Cellulomonas sp. NTE-D12]|uniref:hypothetical protein n=1 Tax=Cellulomonas sp. NTE-D12 TaxID=2962632 RepID=UPI003081C06C|nr:hypothetical protein CELD12_05510 [Cellulomonas sp. NTE-D12]
MDEDLLRSLFDREDVDPRCYSFGSSAPDEGYCLEETYGGWSVYYYERGYRRDERTHGDLDAACLDVLEWVLRDPTTRRRT